MAGTHSGAPGNPDVRDRDTIGAAIAPLIHCGGVAADGSNLKKLFVLAITDDGIAHMKAYEMDPAEVLFSLMGMLDGSAPTATPGLPGGLLDMRGVGGPLEPLSEEDIKKLLSGDKD